MNIWLNYQHLYYFKTIAEEGSVSKAAKKLRLGQSTLSTQLKQFEENLNTKLFERKNKRLLITDQGKITLDYATQIFKLGDEMLQVIDDKIPFNRSYIQIGALDSIAKQVTLSLAKHAYKHFNCQVRVVEGSGEFMLRELIAHRTDLMVSNFIPTDETVKGIFHRLITKKTVSIYAAKKFQHLKSKFPASLKNQPFIMPTYNSKLRYDIEHWLKTNKITIDIIAESQDIGLKKLMATDGLGLIPSTAYSVSLQVKNGDLIEIGKLPGVSEDLFLLSAERKIANPVANELFKKFKL